MPSIILKREVKVCNGKRYYYREETVRKRRGRRGERGKEEKKEELLCVRKRSSETRVTDREGSDLREWHQSAGLMRLAAITCISTAWRGRDLRKRYWMYKPKGWEGGKWNGTVGHEERLVEYGERDVGMREKERENTKMREDRETIRDTVKWGWAYRRSRVNTSVTR